MSKEVIGNITCFLCRKPVLVKRTATAHAKPYYKCGCGVQVFARGAIAAAALEKMADPAQEKPSEIPAEIKTETKTEKVAVKEEGGFW